MAFPQDLSDVVIFKIHPAIGIARVSRNDDYYVYGSNPAQYKSNGLVKRQAVQFKIFAYGANHVGLGELNASVMAQLGITAIWSAEVANRKLEYTAQEQGLPDGSARVFGAAASSDDARQGELVGSLPAFAEGGAIPLGQITDTGLFIPPKAGVHRATAGMAVPDYPDFTASIADTTSDGIIRAELRAAGGIPVLPAWILVAPQDYSPDVDPPQHDASKSLLLFLKQLVASGSGAAGNIYNEAARRLDELALRPATSDCEPGFEVSFGGRSSIVDLAALFYDNSVEPLADPREIRVRPADGGGQGAVPGQLTSGLCSPWQTDFTACLGYWGEHLPLLAHLDEAENTRVNLYRRRYDDTTPFADRLRHGDDFEQHQDKIGVVRIVNGKDLETERDPGDDIP